MGWLDKLAALSFFGAIVGLTLIVIIFRVTDTGHMVGWMLLAWFSPCFLWLACVWAIESHEEWDSPVKLIGVLGLFALFGLRDTGEVLVLFAVMLGLVVLSSLMAFAAQPAAWLLNKGRPEYRKVRLRSQ